MIGSVGFPHIKIPACREPIAVGGVLLLYLGLTFLAYQTPG